jgi:hypothetical protein
MKERRIPPHASKAVSYTQISKFAEEPHRHAREGRQEKRTLLCFKSGETQGFFTENEPPIMLDIRAMCSASSPCFSSRFHICV